MTPGPAPIQLPTWNEALGLPRPWDQQWSLRYQQVLAFETDLLEYEDVFAGSRVVEAATASMADAAWAELDEILDLGGAFEAIEEMKGRLVASQAERSRRIESGEQVVVGVNRFVETEPSPLGGAESILRVDPAVEADMAADVAKWRAGAIGGGRRSGRWPTLEAAARSGDNVMPADARRWPPPEGRPASGPTALRDVFGEYRAPTGVGRGVGHRGAV